MTASISDQLLTWYDQHARDLPWRLPPGEPLPDDPAWPYRVWLSEVMLQQTTVAAVKGYFERFTARWPTVEALAAAEDAEVMAEWAGLGYYARARNLLACARAVAERGGFPRTEAELRTLPGVGPYTAAAVAAIAFGERAGDGGDVVAHDLGPVGEEAGGGEAPRLAHLADTGAEEVGGGLEMSVTVHLGAPLRWVR